MDTELKNASDDAEMADYDSEKVVTMMDVLQEQEDFEEDANAVLGASDDKECTYSKGYIKRQALYACMTCCFDAKNDPTKRAGVCLACSLNCHENHELIELYTKRNFKCDCGNPNFNSHPCQFTSNKIDLNEDNNYNQNFSGVYCTCQRPYPDPESPTEVEMIQCIICEDWLHASHLEATVPDIEQYSEMICKACMEKNEFLHDYGNLAVNIDVDVVTNGIDSDKICNGDINLEKIGDNKTTDQAELDFALASANVANHSAENSEMASEEGESNKNEDMLPDVKGTSDEIKEKSLEMQMDTENSKPFNNITDNTVTNEHTPDTETKKDSESEITHSDARQSESVAELEKTEIVAKTTEQLEEEILLKDPEDDSIKTNVEEITNIKEDESYVQKSEIPQVDDNKSSENTLTDISIKTNATNENKINKENNTNNSDGPNESKNEKVSEIANEKEKNENSTVEMKTLETNASNIEIKEPVTESANKDVKTTEKRKLEAEHNTSAKCKKVKLEEKCTPCVRPKGIKKIHKGATFWLSTFRQKLCTCNQCIAMYTDLSVLYLIDQEDTVTAYENLGKQKINGKPATQYEKGLQALSSLGRIQQINALTEYNKMRDKLLDFLKSFKERREVVKEEDIKAFFAGMKPKRESDGVYFCR